MKRHCPKCNSVPELRDGKDVGGMPGIFYQYCTACGWARAVTKKPGKRDAMRHLTR